MQIGDKKSDPFINPTDPHPELLRYRNDFPIVMNKTFLNTCSLGALGMRTIANVHEYLSLWSEMGASAWYKTWLGKCADLRAGYGRIVGAPADRIALGPSISANLSGIMSALDFSKRKKIIATDLDFSTVGHSLLAKQREGLQVEFLRSPDKVTVPLDMFEAAIDDDTALVVTSHVYFTSGAIQDIKKLAAIAHSKGALLLVDAYHGTGHVPTDVLDCDCDFYTSGSLKWLMGGSGITFMYVHERWRDLEPAIAGWFGMSNMFSFDISDLQWRDNAARFETGTPSMSAVYSALGGLSYIEEIGVQKIRERDSALTEDLIVHAQEAGFTVRGNPNPAERTAIVMLEFDDPATIVGELAKRDIIVDYRPGTVRISPYFYNTIEENRKVIDTIVEVLNS
ncbi:MAG TPA: aminotransferase class V-fold PLP-dependent enzyme [Chloroflexia bacterium]|nr:aminotransferase class V-fold PLP-dependent enzyme [Chloroflexia bacterium]